MSKHSVRTRQLRAGDMLGDQYRVLELLRRGNDLDVYDVWSEVRCCRCVAKLPRSDRVDDPAVSRRLRRESRLLLSLTHPHIVRAYELLTGPPPCLVIEALPGATLSALLAETPRLPLRDLVHLGTHLCSACHYLHGRGYLHLDIKPSNIVVQSGLARLLDLSIARRPGRARTIEGTDLYMSPEQAMLGELGPAADVWGIGLVLYEAARGANPFDPSANQRERQPESALLQSGWRPPTIRAARRLPRGLADAIDACLETDPAGRATLAELSAALCHMRRSG